MKNMFCLLQLNYETGVLKKNGGIDAYKNHSSLGGGGGVQKEKSRTDFYERKRKFLNHLYPVIYLTPSFRRRNAVRNFCLTKQKVKFL